MSGSDYPCRYLKLPLSFDTSEMEQQIRALPQSRWISHMNTGTYEGDWQCLALRSINGEADNIMAVDDASYQDTEALAQCPLVQQALARFDCEKLSVRLMALAPDAHIKPHRDRGGAFEDGIARLHIALQTGPEVVFVVEDESVHFSRGDTWYLNAACTHAVYNRSRQPRVHLMLDCVVNPWLERLFVASGFVARDPGPYGDPSICHDNALKIIANLRALPSPAGLAMAQRLEKIYRAR
ncbi:aspartyl/asparaginyl beta-hydroxylase domain-containing protein [Pseudomonas sp. 21LCFQ02]|uniref:aspartyl/asparaginyl beta-hydroxylase domain-containing protein n=1 Tax=unclassified Pseudomonas TaxID=196821 RepID=UPI00209B7783|nr:MULTISPECIES: aspartyl/asparaginyl beta-hydroxylase domain-containing protein [unclassified Pseudomonas]MCO8169970.1 aspartyl/asparaginyl beta-hydroxylase domain-containing protein [Pseudomonas sp. 21LCFQ02]MCQ9426497.1 aspartyl/asparaginyl beta-hydroxylase domain-containing protein [Pseudomonas sp. LJDD11]